MSSCHRRTAYGQDLPPSEEGVGVIKVVDAVVAGVLSVVLSVAVLNCSCGRAFATPTNKTARQAENLAAMSLCGRRRPRMKMRERSEFQVWYFESQTLAMAKSYIAPIMSA